MARLNGTFRLAHIGHRDFNGDVSAASVAELIEKIRAHMLTREVGLSPDGTVLVGGCGSIGRARPVGEVSELLWKRWFGLPEKRPLAPGLTASLLEASR
jgi:hypothetical protein